MGNGYTRQSSAQIAPGALITDTDLEAEFDTLQAAMAATTGHSHDDTTGEGPKISLTTSISGVLPVANGGTAGINKLNATVAPAATDDTGDGYVVGSIWIDTTADILYVCVDSTLNAAIWKRHQLYDADLEAIAALTSAANKLPYATGAQTWALTDLSAFGRTLIDDAAATNARTTLGVIIGTDVQAQDAELSALAGLTSAANKLPYFTGSGTASLADFTTAGRALVDDADASTQLTTLGVSTYAKTLIDDPDASSALTTLGVSTFIKTLLDDVDATTARATLGVSPAFPAGTKMLFVQTAAPTGWTKDTTHNDKALRIVSGTASTGGTTAFTSCFAGTRTVTGTTDGFTLTATHIPAHTHTQNGSFASGGDSVNHSHTFSGTTSTESTTHTHGFTDNFSSGGALNLQPGGGAQNHNLTSAADNTGGQSVLHTHTYSGTTSGISVAHTHSVTISGETGSIGSGGAHSHTFTSGSFDLAVQYVDVIIATKD